MKIRPIYKMQNYDVDFRGTWDLADGLPSGHIEKGYSWLINSHNGQVKEEDILIANVDDPQKKYGDWVIQRVTKQDYLLDFT